LILWVELPLRPQTAPDRWSLGEMPFALTEGTRPSRILRKGKATVGELPQASRRIFILPSADVLLTPVDSAVLQSLPPARLREALPNLLEEGLVQPAEQCHFALGQRKASDTPTAVAVVDRAWFRYLHETITASGMANVEIVPGQLFQGVETLRISTSRLGQQGADESLPVLSWRSGLQAGWGLRRHEGDAVPWYPGLPSGIAPIAQQDLDVALEQGAEDAFNLCQFEFAPTLGGLAQRLKPWRNALVLLAAALLLQLLAMNLHWARLAWQKRALAQSMAALVRDNVPNAPADLPAAVVMKHALANLRQSEGGQAPGDFSALASRLAGLMAGEPGDAISMLEYREESLMIRFRPGYSADALAKKASAKGISLKNDGRGLWRLSAGEAR
jgi:general secretion pathway protein L